MRVCEPARTTIFPLCSIGGRKTQSILYKQNFLACVLFIVCMSLPTAGNSASQPLASCELYTNQSKTIAWIPVFINGKGPFNLVVDTGADCLALGQNVLDALHLQGSSAQAVTDASGTRGVVQKCLISNVQIGNLTLNNITASVTANLGHGIDGFIGSPLFLSYAVQFDFANRKLNIYNPFDIRFDPKHSVGMKIGMDIYRSPIVSATVDGNPTIGFIDTGCGVPLKVTSLWIKSVVCKDPLQQTGVGGNTMLGRFEGDTYDVQSLTIGDQKLLSAKPITTLVTRDLKDDVQGFGVRIGLWIFKDFTTTIIYPRLSIVLSSPTTN